MAMRKGTAVLLLWMLALAAQPNGIRSWAQGEKKEAPPPLALKVGDEAPDFTLPDDNGNKVTLSSFKGKKNVALAFYIFAFTGG
jgi:cytochrome oxidase Cu insertion factor (SCO1/SenC/PrrC family)